MTMQVSIREGESQESLLRRFQKVVQMSGVLRDAKSTRYFVSDGEKRRMRAQQSARRRLRDSAPR